MVCDYSVSYKNHTILPLKPRIDGSVQDCSISTANALKIPQAYPKPSVYENV